MKKKSVIALCVVVVLIILFGTLAFKGIPLGDYDWKPIKDAVSLGLDLRGGVYAVYQGDTSAEDFDAQMDATVTIMINRLTAQGYTEATVTRQGNDRIRIEIPDVQDPNEILTIVGTPAHLTFIDPNGEIVLEGSSVKSAQAGYDQESGKGNDPVIYFQLDDEGTKAFAAATEEFLNQIITIKLDETTLTAPRVQSVISEGSGIINGFSDLNEAVTIANLIMSGALPLDITLIESSAVSATLGVDALSTSLTAGIIGILLIMLFMIVVYRIPGVVADLALMIYMLIVAFALAVVPGVQLTLPGIAGLLLGVGMAVDGNVIIFERFREELKTGRSVGVSAQRGYKNALSSIIDSNVTTIIAAIVLVRFGTGSIKGFAMTLLIGVIASMISSVFITRFLLNQATGLGIKGDKLWTR